MKLFFDTEFTGLKQDTTLISIGIISENNDTFYAEFVDYKKEDVDEWIQDNVISNLKFANQTRLCRIGQSDTCVEMIVKGYSYFIKDQLTEFLFMLNDDGRTDFELYSDVCHYDMVLFAQLFGGAMEVPSNVSACCYDINNDIKNFYNCRLIEAFNKNREEIIRENNPNSQLLQAEEKHNSLYDAKVIKEIYEIVSK